MGRVRNKIFRAEARVDPRSVLGDLHRAENERAYKAIKAFLAKHGLVPTTFSNRVQSTSFNDPLSLPTAAWAAPEWRT
jgi:hypothetical protein